MDVLCFQIQLWCWYFGFFGHFSQNLGKISGHTAPGLRRQKRNELFPTKTLSFWFMGSLFLLVFLAAKKLGVDAFHRGNEERGFKNWKVENDISLTCTNEKLWQPCWWFLCSTSNPKSKSWLLMLFVKEMKNKVLKIQKLKMISR